MGFGRSHMAEERKTVAEINEKLKNGEAVVMTAMEFKKEVRRGRKFKVSDVDVVTTGTRGVMSGTSAMLAIPLAEPGTFMRARQMWLNGVPCILSSNTEEGTGIVEAVVYGTEESRDHHGYYGGGNLLRDLVEGKEVDLECLTSEGDTISKSINLDQLRFARLYNFRNCFQNYMAFGNFKNHRLYRENPSSIFACRPVPLMRGLTVSGSGELNPLENDRYSKVMKSGTKILLNGKPGVIVGNGTRSNPAKRCLCVAGDMKGMDPQYMGGFRTSFGVEVTNCLAIPFPITDREVLNGLADCLDEKIPLQIADLADRIGIFGITYADIWKDAPLEIEFDADRCICCSFQCPAEYYCPMKAISWKDKRIDESLCVACGACTSNCLGGAFKGKGSIPKGCIGTVHAFERDIPIIFRQSNRYRSEKVAERLKDLMLKGEFLLSDSDLELRFWNL
jgi:putative methanogenesis marker 16 metalloprotein